MTIDDMIFLRDNYNKHRTIEFSKRFGVSPKTIQSIGHAFGLTKIIHKLSIATDKKIIEELRLKKPIKKIAQNHNCSVSHVCKVSKKYSLNYQKSWSKIEEKRLVDQIKKGTPIEMIAADHNRPEASIRSKMWRLKQNSLVKK